MEDYEYEDIEEFSDDLRLQELQSIKAIFPMATINFKLMSGAIDIPLKADQGLLIKLVEGSNELASQEVKNLPPAVFHFEIPEEYPFNKAPLLQVVSTVIPSLKLDRLLLDLLQIWTDYHDQCIFSMIEYLNEFTQNKLNSLVLHPFEVNDQVQYYDLVDFNKNMVQQEFENRSFSCEICQSECKGSVCLKFECDHIFCNDCLFDYFSSIIDNGEIGKVHCPHFDCTKEIVERKLYFSKLKNWTLLADNGENTLNIEKIMNSLLVPHVSARLLDQIFLTKDSSEQSDLKIKKYQLLFQKSQYDFIGKLLPKRLVNCPKPQCNLVIFRRDLNDRLVVCIKCRYAFCYDCHNSYHTRFALCKKMAPEGETYWGIPIKDLEEYLKYSKESFDKKTMNARYGLKIIKKALEEYQMDQFFSKMLSEDSSMVECPSCLVIIEKTDGCNKMTCSQCFAHFCFLCGIITNNSYYHFSNLESTCYKKLFIGMTGVEDLHMIGGGDI